MSTPAERKNTLGKKATKRSHIYISLFCAGVTKHTAVVIPRIFCALLFTFNVFFYMVMLSMFWSMWNFMLLIWLSRLPILNLFRVILIFFFNHNNYCYVVIIVSISIVSNNSGSSSIINIPFTIIVLIFIVIIIISIIINYKC